MNPQSLTPKQIAKMLETFEVLDQIKDAVKARAIELVHKGVVIPGYEADFTTPRRMWSDEEQANELLEDLGLSKRDRYSVELLSPAQAEKALRKAGKWPKKPRGSAAEDFINPLRSVLSYTETKPTISKASKDS